jgi:two-component system, NtrC family, response regulator AtoC
VGERDGEGGSPDEHATLRLDTAAQRAALVMPERITIVVVMPSSENGKVEHVLERGRSCVIGRSEDCEVHVAEPSISRQHVRLSYSMAGTILVEDLGSANGTRVGARILAAGETGELVQGDVLEIGAVFVVVDRVGLHGGRAVAQVGRERTATRQPASNMEALHALVARVAKSTLSVLVLGETGAGKEVLAERLHELSPRAGRPLLRLNCAALSEQLLESELFGHERGAFTGAVQSKIGLLETAHTGTIFLDEVGELPLSLQAKLLRVLEDRKVLRVGALKPKEIDVRFVAATNRDLLAEIAAGRFRQDLYFRLNGISVFIPPLRERIGEIVPLAEKFAAAAAKAQGRTDAPTFSMRARLALETFPWPGNVRELKNVIERAVVLSENDELDVADLGLSTGRAGSTAPAKESSSDVGAGLLKDDVDALEQRRILDALAECSGNQTRAAKLLGISRGTLVSRLERFGVSRPRKKP